MADEHAEWSTESNDAVHISLVNPSVGGTRTLYTFNPAMTYSVFGDDERVFGYQGLKINLRFNACDMRPGLQIQYTKRFKQVGETAPTDLKELLEPYLPQTAFEKTFAFDAAITNTSSWTPPGELYRTIQSGDHTLEIWKGNLEDPAIQQMIKRIQILVPFFIDGGTFIELSEPPLDRWTVFFLYEKRVDVQPDVSPYVFMGYSTVYRYFYFRPIESDSRPARKQRISYPADLDFELSNQEESTFSSLPCRSRISQFIILPPFQKEGNGSRFYNAIFDFYLAESQTIDITVEDPNEAFDDMRDVNDLQRLRGYPEFTALRINSAATLRSKGPVPRDIVDHDALEKLRVKIKIAPRQFYRVVEMQLLSLIPQSVRQSLTYEAEVKNGKNPEYRAKEHEYHLWTLWVKKRVYKHNKDTLIQVALRERIEKLTQAIEGVKNDYDRLLDLLGRRIEKRLEQVEVAKKSNGNGKRLSPGDEADKSEDEDEPVAKRAKNDKSKAA